MTDLLHPVLQQNTDLRSAMTSAGIKYLLGLEFRLPRGVDIFKFRDVYPDWRSFSETRASPEALPVAAFLPDRPVYEDSQLTPRLCEETWSGGDPSVRREDGSQKYPFGDGSGDGTVLVTFAEMAVPFLLVVRAKDKPTRRAIIQTLEQSFLEDGTLPDTTYVHKDLVTARPEVQPVRYGRRLQMPLYFNREVRFTLLAHQLIDSAEKAKVNEWEALVELTAHARVCTLRRVRAMSARVRLLEDDEVVSR